MVYYERHYRRGASATGWHTLLTGLIATGWEITATWPMRTGTPNRMITSGTNTLASSWPADHVPRTHQPRPAGRSSHG